MRTLSVFETVSLDGYFCDSRGSLDWAHKGDPEWNEFVSGNASGEGVLVFGRKTYEMMASFWPTPAGCAANATVAKRMSAGQKLVFSRTLKKSPWENTQILSGDPAAEIRRIKGERGPDMVILGSGSIVAQLTEARLVDAYQLVVAPVVLGAGRTLFEGVTKPLELRLEKTRTFKNGNVVLWYRA